MARRWNPGAPHDISLMASGAAIGGCEPERASLRSALDVLTGGWDGELHPGDLVFVPDGGGSISCGRASKPVRFGDPPEAWEALAANGVVPMPWTDGEMLFMSADLARSGETSLRWLAPGGEWRTADGRRAPQGEPGERGPKSQVEAVDELGLSIFLPRRRGADGPGYYRCTWPSPRTMRQVVALASDAANVARVTSLAREAMRRLGPWMPGVPSGARSSVAWADPHVGAGVAGWRCPWASASGAVSSAAMAAWHGAMEHFGRRRVEAVEREASELSSAAPRGSLLSRAVATTLLWRELSDARAWLVRETDRRGVFVADTGSGFAEMPCPFEPMLDIWAMGYGLHDTVGPNSWIEVPPIAVPG